MGNRIRFVARPVAFLALLFLTAGITVAADAGVKDDGNLFSPNVAAQATNTLKRLQQQYRHTVIVETYANLPTELAGRVDGNDASKNRAYVDFMEMRARSLGADVYIYACKSPGHVDSAARRDVARSGLTDAGRQRMTADLLGRFKNRDFDGGLTNLTASLEKTFAGSAAANGPSAGTAMPPAASPPPDAAPRQSPVYSAPARTTSSGSGFFGSLGCIGVIILVVIAFVVIRLIGRLIGGSRNAPPPLPPGAGYGGNAPPPGGYGPGYGNPGGGGGFGRGVGGGILGGLLGSWIGGNVFGQGHHGNDNDSGHSGGGVFGGGSNDPGPAGGGDSGFSAGGGGDFNSGSSAGGNDFSAGGGGDFGGGGDSGGGGGGDSGGGGGGGGDF